MRIRRQHFINKIKDLGCYFVTSNDRTDVWRKSGSTIYVPIPRGEFLADLYVRTWLAFLECDHEEIESFLGPYGES